LAGTARQAGGSGDADGSGRRSGRGVGDHPNDPSAARSGSGDRSGGVALGERSWSCPWPREAEAQRIDEQTVVIKVVVDPDGTVASATVVSDPGHGFGRAAVACALHTRFIPARDRDGRPIRAESPSVLVRFTR
jgi:protein TonB